MANGKGGSKEIKSVMFIPYTAHSELATRMRENEEMMKEMTGYRIKIVEKTGVKLVDMLHRANPWAGEECGRNRCLLCETKKREVKKNSQDCHKRNCVYQTYCRTCTERQDRQIEEKFKEMGKKRIEEEKRKERRFLQGKPTGASTRGG